MCDDAEYADFDEKVLSKLCHKVSDTCEHAYGHPEDAIGRRKAGGCL